MSRVNLANSQLLRKNGQGAKANELAQSANGVDAKVAVKPAAGNAGAVRPYSAMT
jgi:hypothetical protein